VTAPTRGDWGEDEVAACGERAATHSDVRVQRRAGARLARAEFYLCLARAFLTPATEEAYRGMTHFLADDLEDLGQRLGYPLADALGNLRVALSAIPDHLGLLQLYSKLFLSPPVPVHLNAGVYLDGALLGASVLAMEQHYRRHGVQRAASFHDLPDHVALQLEFVAYLFADAHGAPDACEAARREAAAYEFLAEFVAAWAPAFSASLARVARTPGLASPYPALAEILRSAVAHDTADRHTYALIPIRASVPRDRRPSSSRRSRPSDAPKANGSKKEQKAARQLERDLRRGPCPWRLLESRRTRHSSRAPK
jgi:TorA maturation chaperone TorD